MGRRKERSVGPLRQKEIKRGHGKGQRERERVKREVGTRGRNLDYGERKNAG